MQNQCYAPTVPKKADRLWKFGSGMEPGADYERAVTDGNPGSTIGGARGKRVVPAKNKKPYARSEALCAYQAEK